MRQPARGRLGLLRWCLGGDPGEFPLEHPLEGRDDPGDDAEVVRHRVDVPVSDEFGVSVGVEGDEAECRPFIGAATCLRGDG